LKLDRFTLLHTLGSGASARVVGALDGDRRVALKISHPHLGEAGREALLEEARLASGFSHSSLVTPQEVLVVDESAVLVLDWIEGTSLDALEVMPEAHAIAGAMQAVASGLAALHEAGLVHRDVHPANLLIDRAGALRLIDFGLTTRVGARSPGAVGRFGYLSPEQARGDAVDGRSDVFSLGVVLWECVMGRRLHPAGNRASTLTDVVTREPPEVRGPFAGCLAAALQLDREARVDAQAFWALLAESAK
jgi:eukaryotic-like serine/threonine-protein kinase